MHESPARRHFLATVEFTEIPVWYARNTFFAVQLKRESGIFKSHVILYASKGSSFSELFIFTAAGVKCMCGGCKVFRYFIMWQILFEPPHDKTNKMAYALSEDSDQPGHPPSLKKAGVLSYPLSAQ